MKKNIQTIAPLMALLAAGLLTPALAQTTHIIGSAVGTDFPDLATAIASPSVVAGDTLLLDPANNGAAMFAPAEISKGVIVQGQNGPSVGGANWFINTSADAGTPVAVQIRDLTVTGGGANGIVVNGNGTDLTIDGVTVTAKSNFGVNINTGTVTITGASVISNNGGSGVSIGGGANTSLTIQGTEATPVVISDNGLVSVVAPVTQAAVSIRSIAGGVTTTVSIENAVLSGSRYGFVNDASNNFDQTVTMDNVEISNMAVDGFLLAGAGTDVTLTNVDLLDIQEIAIFQIGNNTSVTYDGGTVTGRTTADANPVDNFEKPLVYVTGGTNKDFVGSNLLFPAGNTPGKLRSEAGVIQISDSVLNGGTGPFGFIYVGGGGAEFTNCTFIPQGQSIAQAVGGSNPITVIDPTFAGTTTGFAFYLQGHSGEFSVIGTDPANKVSLDGMANVAVFARNWGGTANFTNVTATDIGSLFDTFGMGVLAGPVEVNIDQSVFFGDAGRVTFFENAGSSFPGVLNATNSMWLGTVNNSTSVLNVNDPTRTVGSAINLTHSTIAVDVPMAGSILINAENGKDTVTGNYLITDASGTNSLLASGAVLAGQGNLVYSTGGATASGGWINGFPLDTIIADPLLDVNGELTAGSPAIDNAVGSTATVDYAGNVRPQGLGVDIGAHEAPATSSVHDWSLF